MRTVIQKIYAHLCSLKLYLQSQVVEIPQYLTFVRIDLLKNICWIDKNAICAYNETFYKKIWNPSICSNMIELVGIMVHELSLRANSSEFSQICDR